MLLPIDSNAITLTSELFFDQSFYQIKILGRLKLSQEIPEKYLMYLVQGNDARFLG